MSRRFEALCVSFVVFLLRLQNISPTPAQAESSPTDFDFPEIDGSAVDDTCRIFSTDGTAETEGTTSPTTTKQVVATTEKPEAQTPQRTPQTPDPGALGRPQPDNSQTDLAARLLANLLANSRGPGANPLKGFFSQPMGGLPYSVTSDSDESAVTLLKDLNGNRWKTGWFSSESSDES